MIAKVHSGCVVGVEGTPVVVEVDVSNGLPGLQIVGLPDKSVEESRERVRAALRATNLPLPAQRVVINLAPADLRKAGSAFDLPMAVGLMVALGQLPEIGKDAWFVGELALDGAVRPVGGCLPIAATLAAAGGGMLIVPADNAAEAALVGNRVTILPVRTLAEVVAHFVGEESIRPFEAEEPTEGEYRPSVDLSDIRGQSVAKRAVTVTAAGNHNLLLTGPPGTGKTLLARVLAGLLPPLTVEEALEVTTIHSVAGELPARQPLRWQRPFRNPHHAISVPGLVGGGNPPRPGELSLAHRGVLFLDELPQFPPHALDAIRGPLEDRAVIVARAQQRVRFPTDCLLVASQNPCPCGYASDPVIPCQCAPAAAARYTGRVSGPIRDRFDLTVEVPRLPAVEFARPGEGDSSLLVLQQVITARQRQATRQGAGRPNASLTNRELTPFCSLGSAAEQLLRTAVDQWGLSVRGYHRILRVARTIADLAERDQIEETDVAEALQYRPSAVGNTNAGTTA